ncbi:peptidase m12a astacin [Rhizobium leguminosarum]|uniref:Dot/Icm T4SS effector Zinc-dependent metalloprotease LegP n=1 Tax=Rhizobium TaxID=379 RepID=UPI001032046D|nr:Dot/Icm T4SS effector Zinc-dependent metalloprotease LegP [Rhizobium leguminosarum]TBF87899.1 peptidase m12a astacin [Rhizobium leguminosarum]TBG07120.1 peptidase m12a astacin [Rhizobium leguminosarum]TBG07684.1 peptidase m12a astacin [Rhizobium leguminosarum]TBG30804.1 peptidase m12a astacin [Rhizobium leguminosarum]TBG50050.1 peptidase m12a astacin [Rhizobium leguminosarum]
MATKPRAKQDPCEQSSGPIAGTALISAATFNRKPLQYADVDGWAIFEGDIILGRTVDLQQAEGGGDGSIAFSIGITGQGFRWPNAQVPFEIDPAMPDQQRVTDAIAHWHGNTPLRFAPRAGESDFVTFRSGSGCSSQVGRRGGQQFVTLGPGCSTGNAIHEIGHTIGLWHEQSREDRDSFVRIVFANIDPSMQHNFTQHIADGDDLGAYDYGSIMHYPRDAFSNNGQDTIIPLQPLPPGVVMGQRNGLSSGDIAGVLMLYPRAATIKEVRKDPITDPTIKEIRKEPVSDPTIKEIRKDPISDPTIKELRKDPILDTVKEAGKDPIRDTVKEIRGDPTLAEVVGIPGPGPINQPGFGVTPFVMAGGSRFGGGGVQDSDGYTEVQALAEALLANEQQRAILEQEHAELSAAYEAAVRAVGGG